MSYTLIFTDSYKKRIKRFAQQHPELKEQYRKTLLLLAQIKGKLAALHSVSINISYWITLDNDHHRTGNYSGQCG